MLSSPRLGSYKHTSMLAAYTKRRLSESTKRYALFVKAFHLNINIIYQHILFVNCFLQFISLNFSAYCFWKLISEHDDSRIFIRCGMLFDIILNFFFNITHKTKLPRIMKAVLPFELLVQLLLY